MTTGHSGSPYISGFKMKKKMLNNGCFVSKIHSTNVFGRTGILKFYESHVYFDLPIMSVGFYLKQIFET